MGRRRYMTKRRIEEKISKQRKASLFMVLVVMITAITLTYKNVDGDFSRLMGNAVTNRTKVVVHVGGRYKMNLNESDYVISSISSDDESIATVTDYGVIRGKKEGSTRINIKYRIIGHNNNYYYEYVDVVVKRQESYAAETRCVAAGGKWSIINGCTFSKDNSSDDGNSYTPNNSGSGGNYNSNNDSLDEKNESINGSIVIPKLTINSSDVVLYVNKTYQLKVTSNIKNDKITYSSNDKNIVIVGSKGLIKGKKEGQAKITATSSSGATIDVNITVGKKFDIGVNYGPNSKVSINKSNKVILNVTDTRLINVWLFDDKLNGNTIYERDYNKVKKSGAIEVKNLPEKGKTKKFYVKNRDSAKLYSYTTFVIKNNNGKYNRSTGPTIKNVRGLQIGDEKYIAYTVSSSHGLSAIKDGKANGKFDNTYSDLNGVNEQSNIVKLSDMNKSKNNYYYLWIHAADNSSFKNYTRTSVQIKLK